MFRMQKVYRVHAAVIIATDVAGVTLTQYIRGEIIQQYTERTQSSVDCVMKFLFNLPVFDFSS